MECVFTLAFVLCVEGAFVYMYVGMNKFHLQYPGCGVLSNELWRTITNSFLRDDCFLSRPGTRFNLGHADELASLTLVNFVKFSGHLWRFLVLYGL